MPQSAKCCRSSYESCRLCFARHPLGRFRAIEDSQEPGQIRTIGATRVCIGAVSAVPAKPVGPMLRGVVRFAPWYVKASNVPPAPAGLNCSCECAFMVSALCSPAAARFAAVRSNQDHRGCRSGLRSCFATALLKRHTHKLDAIFPRENPTGQGSVVTHLRSGWWLRNPS